jgi:hypothetical protein
MDRSEDDMNARIVAIAALLASFGPAYAKPTIIEVTTSAELKEKWCAADPNQELILVLPASMFVNSEQLICNGGAPYKLYRVVEHDDPDDYEYFLDPPFGSSTTRLGCDGKAGRSMQTVALNCRPLKPPGAATSP